MNVLTDEHILAVGREILPGKILNSTSVAYIQSLLIPYAENIEKLTQLDTIEMWLRDEFQGRIANILMKSVGDIINDAENRLDVAAVAAAKTMIILKLVREILLSSRTESEIVFPRDNTILPWDIQSAVISADSCFEGLFGAGEEGRTLPVDIVIGGNTFRHMLSCEFVIGLILSGCQLQIFMFGVEFPRSYLDINFTDTTHNHRFYYDGSNDDNNFDAVAEYSVLIDIIRYTFHTPDFMQGIKTGAGWREIDHHTIWSDLMHHTWNEYGDPVNERITF